MPSYIFNRTNIAIIIGIAIIFGISFNEIARFIGSQRERTQEAISEYVVRLETTYTSQETCQSSTGRFCSFESCDFVPPGKTFEEVCGEDFEKGWKPTNTEIPSIYRNLELVRLDIFRPSARGIIEIRPRENKMTYISVGASGTSSERSQTIASHESTTLLNKFILYDFTRIAERQGLRSDSADKSYEIAIYALEHSSTNGTGASPVSASFTCDADSCPREIIDIKNDIERLWRGSIIEE